MTLAAGVKFASDLRNVVTYVNEEESDLWLAEGLE